MAAKNHHSKPYDEGTLTKLEIFEMYAKEWLPTFIMTKVYTNLWIFDFFAGPGYDNNGIEGSPIRLLKQISGHIGYIFSQNKIINICFNEYDDEKFELLKKSCDQYIEDNAGLLRAKNNNRLKINYRNCDTEDLFEKTLPNISNNPALVYLDQNGVKFLADKYFLQLANTKTTDFLYFVSSSYILRFGDSPEFSNSIKIDMDKAKSEPYKYIHKELLRQLKEKLPEDTHLSLFPFSIKKGKNIYGIIFGASHIRAVEKFLTTAWSQNDINGEANFDIDDDQNKSQLDLFCSQSLTKIEKFKLSLRNAIMNGGVLNNRDAFTYAMERGHISKHAKEEVAMMKKEGLITFETKQPLISYEKTYGRNKRIVIYTKK